MVMPSCDTVKNFAIETLSLTAVVNGYWIDFVNSPSFPSNKLHFVNDD